MTSDRSSLGTALIAAIVAALVSAAGIGIFVAATGDRQDETIASPAGQDTQAIEKTVRDYLIKNPEILVEMSQALEERQTAAQEAAQRTAIASNADAIFRSDVDFVAGNPKGDVTIVEFFDYNCGYCRRAMPDLVKLIENDDKVRVVFKEFPILRRESEGAARVVLAAIKQGKYFDLHRAMFETKGIASEESALKVAAELGLDVDKLKQDMKAPEIDKAIRNVRELANKLGVQGTPFYLVGDRVVPGAPADLYDQLATKVSEVRKDGCDTTVTC